MNNTQLLIPAKIRVGFQNRNDTYTKKLAYVIYYDTVGKLRKEKSWESWRDKAINPIEYENSPTEGFVLNKNVGGYKSNWNYRSSHIRVYDPRDFEFEISVENLLLILSCVDCTRGKGLEGKFVYAWDGTELVLLPEDSENYKYSSVFTKLQNLSVKANTLVPGHTYITKRQETLIYIGKLDSYNNFPYDRTSAPHCVKLHVFWNESIKNWSFLKELKSLAAVQSDIVVSNYAELRDSYYRSKYGTAIEAIELVELENILPNNYSNRFFTKLKDGTICGCYYHSNKTQVTIEVIITLKNGYIEEERCYMNARKNELDKGDSYNVFPSWTNIPCKNYYLDYWLEPINSVLKITMKSGSVLKFDWANSVSEFSEEDKIVEK